jgi:predicted hydrolase (HD superfamily)
VRPEGLTGMTPKSVKKKMKQPSFAAAVSRDDLTQGAESLGIDFDEHIANVISALGSVSDAVLPNASGDGAAEAA